MQRMMRGMAEAGRIERPERLKHLWINAQEWGLARLDRLASRQGSTTAPHLATGLRGERAALFELRRRGYIVVARRWTSPKVRGDADLIAWHSNQLCFIEVKTRTARDMTPAETAVDEQKRETLRGIARAYLQTFSEAERRTIPVRFDVISVYSLGGTLEFDLFENAFGWR